MFIKKIYPKKQENALDFKKMSYEDFLKTDHWKEVSKKKKKECGNRCQLCNGGKKLQTHHRTYDILGKELENMMDLTVLCSFCHAKYHDKEISLNNLSLKIDLLYIKIDDIVKFLDIFNKHQENHE